MRNFSKYLLFLIAIAICDMRYAICNLFAQDRIVAIVNNDIITQKDLDDFINFMQMQLAQGYEPEQLQSKIQSIKLDLLDRLIEDRLILQEARRNNLTIDASRTKAKIDEIKKRYSSDIEFQNALSQQGLVQADIEQRIREQLLMYNIIEQKVKSKVVVNPGEVTDFYYENIQEFKISEQREFESIAVADESKALELFNNLKSGEDFSETAKKYSLVVNRLTARQEKELRKDIEAVIFRLNPGEASEPIKINENFYIFKLINIIPPRQKTILEVQDRIFTFLFDRKMQEELIKWLEELKKNAYIKIISD